MARRSRTSTGCSRPAGWPYASAEPVGAGDPGRFHALFGRDSAIVSLEVLPARPTSPARPCGRSPRCRGRRGPRDRRGAGQDRPRVVAEGARRACGGRLAGARRGAPLLRLRRLDLLVPGPARVARRPGARRASWSRPGARPAAGWNGRSTAAAADPPRAAPGAGRPRAAGLARRRGPRRPGPPRRRHPHPRRRGSAPRSPTPTPRRSPSSPSAPWPSSQARSDGPKRPQTSKRRSARTSTLRPSPSPAPVSVSTATPATAAASR